MSRIILITGGQRSGKSAFAEKMALSLAENPVYMATAHVWDEEFRLRVSKHQQRRGPEWTNIEEERWLSRHDLTGKVVLVDCCTLWLTNWLYGEPQQMGKDNGQAESIYDEFERLREMDATFIFVTNEIGLGGVRANEVQRRFTDELGLLNQHIASHAQEVYLVISGIQMRIK